MRKIYQFMALALMIMNLAACSEDEKKTSAEDKFLSVLAHTWQPETVMLDDEDVTDEFPGMTITFKKDGTYTVQNPVGDIWSASGMFTVQKGSGDLFNLLREDDVLVTVTQLNDASLVFAMQFDSAPGKTRGLAGEYVFEMSR